MCPLSNIVFCPAALWYQRHSILVACHLMQIVVFFQSEMPEAFNIGSQPFLWLVWYVVNISIDAVRYRMLYLLLLFLSHTYGMVIDVCFLCPSHRNGWLPMFDASGIFHLLKYGLLAYFDLTSRTMARGWRRYDGWPRKKSSFDSYVLLSNLKTHRPQHMYFDICWSKDENVKLFWCSLIITIRGQKRAKIRQKGLLKVPNWKKIIFQLRKYIFPTGK